MKQLSPSAIALLPCSSSPSPLPSIPPPLLSNPSHPLPFQCCTVQFFLEQLLLQMPELVNQADPMQDFLIGMLF